LALSGSLCFEQLYEEVEGDSASAAELCALLSSISDIPLKQGIAVTGSVNQHGEIQPVGGVTHKVEGFYQVCKAKGLTGDQGVIIPAQNVDNLMVKEEVITQVKMGRFHVWSVQNVDEVLHLLTGLNPGECGPDGRYAPDTVHGQVDQKLSEWARLMTPWQ